MTVNEHGLEIPHQHSAIKDIKSCQGVFVGMSLPNPYSEGWILGDVFLAQYYTIYDKTNK